MLRLTWVLGLAVLLVFTSVPLSQAQTLLSQGPTTGFLGNGNDFYHLAVEYTRTVVIGVVAGGALLNIAVGGSWATLAGAVAGSTVAGFAFFEYQAQHYMVQRVTQ